MKTPIRLFGIFFTLLCLAVLPNAQAVVPPPDGGYPNFNTAEGQNALFSLSTGVANSAVGWYSLFSNTDGSFNTGLGAGTLLFNVGDQSTGEGTQNTAVGTVALLFNTTGLANTASGVQALFSNTTGSNNTANGVQALFLNTEGAGNTAIGRSALFSNTTGITNTASGVNALFSNTTGIRNTASGGGALIGNTTGSNNTADGRNALRNNTTGSSNIALGFSAGENVTTADNVISIGSVGADLSNSCFVGNIRGATTANADAIPVLIDSAGQLGTMSSSRRFKHEIKPMDETSEAVLALKPVTFHYRSDRSATPQFGLIAEEVAKVNPDLVVRDKNGDIYTVRYEAVNAMLLNEFLKEHREVEQLKSKLAQQESAIAEQQQDFQAMTAQQESQIRALIASVEKQAAQIQKVSTQVGVSKAPLQLTAAESP